MIAAPSFEDAAAARGLELRDLSGATRAALADAWRALSTDASGCLSRDDHRPVLETFGPHPRLLGEAEIELLKRDFPERAAELSAVSGWLAVDEADDPLRHRPVQMRRTIEHFVRLNAPSGLIEGHRAELSRLEATLGPADPGRVFGYPRDRSRWPGYAREAALLSACLERIGRRLGHDAFDRMRAVFDVARRDGVVDGAIWPIAAQIEEAWEGGARQPEILGGHFAFCCLDWLAQRHERTDQDDLAEIAFSSWESLDGSDGHRLAWWQWWLLEAVPAAYRVIEHVGRAPRP